MAAHGHDELAHLVVEQHHRAGHRGHPAEGLTQAVVEREAPDRPCRRRRPAARRSPRERRCAVKGLDPRASPATKLPGRSRYAGWSDRRSVCSDVSGDLSRSHTSDIGTGPRPRSRPPAATTPRHPRDTGGKRARRPPVTDRRHRGSWPARGRAPPLPYRSAIEPEAERDEPCVPRHGEGPLAETGWSRRQADGPREACRPAASMPDRARAAARARSAGSDLGVRQRRRAERYRARPAATGPRRSDAGRGETCWPAELMLHRLAHVEQLLGLEGGAHAQAGVQKVRLVEQVALRRGLVGGARRDHLDPCAASASARREGSFRSPRFEPMRKPVRPLSTPRPRPRPRAARWEARLGRLDAHRLGPEAVDQPIGHRGAEAPERLVGTLLRSRARPARRPRRSRSCPQPGR